MGEATRDNRNSAHRSAADAVVRPSWQRDAVVRVAVCVVVCSAPAPAAAQPAPSSGIVRSSPPDQAPSGGSAAHDEARAHFLQGLARSSANDWEGALASFRRSLTLYPTRAAWKNAALCLERMGRFDEAMEALEALEEHFPQFSEEERASFAAKMAELSRRVGVLDLRGVAPGSRISIDDRDRGLAPPRSPLRVLPGTRHVRITAGDGASVDATVEAIAGAVSMLPAQAPTPSAPARALPETPLAPRVSQTTDTAPRPSPAPADNAAAPARFGIGARASGSFGSLGGDIVDCSDGCRRSLGWGGKVQIEGSYRFAERWRIAADVGYLVVGQTVDGRATNLMATGYVSRGAAADTLTLRGALLGISAQYQPPRLGPTFGHLGLGALVGSVLDERTGDFASGAAGGAVGAYSITPPLTQRPPLECLYVSLGFGASWRVAPNWVLGAALEIMSLFALRQPAWHEQVLFVTPDGESSFARETLAGRPIVLWSPSLVARHDL